MHSAVLDAPRTGELLVTPVHPESDLRWGEPGTVAPLLELLYGFQSAGTRLVNTEDFDLLSDQGVYIVRQINAQARPAAKWQAFLRVAQPTPIFVWFLPHSSLGALEDLFHSTLLGIRRTPIQSIQESSTASGKLPKARNPIAAAEDLQTWLGLTNKDLQSITGIPERTFYDWKRTERVYRPSTVRRLWRAHALVHAVVKKLGVEDARRWFHSGAVSPLDLLLAGDLDAAEEAAHALLFRSDATEREGPTDRFPFVPDADYNFRREPGAVPRARANRRPRRSSSSRT